MGERELLEMLLSEADRRTPAIVDGVKRRTEPAEPSSEEIEQIRVDAHGLKGAAMVVGQTRLSELAKTIEIALVQRIAPGMIDPDLSERLVQATDALREGVRAAAEGKPEPPSVGDALASLSDPAAYSD